MRKLVRKVTVSGIKPIPEADKIELAMIGGRQCVVGKGDFHIGDKALYFEIDSCLPCGDERYSFLKERCRKVWKNKQGEVIAECIKIKTMKMRGEISQGLLLPLGLFPELDSIPEGENCAEILGVELFDDLEGRYNLRFRSGEQKGVFPSWIPKTDEERIQNLPDWWEKYKEVEWEATRKVDGSSMTVFYSPSKRPEDPFGVCSRNFELKLESDSSYVTGMEKFHLKEKLEKIYKDLGMELAIQGELHRIGMNGNRDGLSELLFAVFKIWNIPGQRFLLPHQRREICETYGIPHVPVLKEHFQVFQELPTMEEILQFTEGKTENGKEREGVVFKSEGEPALSFKVISNAYLLKQKD